MRMTTDIQKAAFAHLINCRLRPPHARDHGPPRLAADQRPDVHPAGRPGVDDRLRQGRPVGDRRARRHALSRLDADPDRARRLSAGGAAGRERRQAAALGGASHPGRARRHDLAADREARRRAPDQGVPPRGLCDRAPQPQFRADLPAAHEGGARARPHRARARGAGGHRHRRRRRLRLLAHRQPASARSAISWASSPRCCWRRSPSSRWAT